MKIILTNSPFYGEGWHGIRAGCRWPFIFDSPKPPEGFIGDYNTFPFFMAYAANYLISNKVGEVYFYDALANKYTYETFYKTIDQIKPDIVLLETSTPSIANDLKIAETLKGKEYEIALAGPHSTTYADTLIKLPYVDYILKGEYEANALEMCIMRKKGIYNCRPLMNFDNIYPYRDGGIYNYGDGFGQDKYVKMPQLQIHTSRGCPYHCRFCLWNEVMTGRWYRARSINSVAREISHCINTYHFESILLDDDTVNVGDKRTNEISKLMDNFGIDWHSMVRADSCSWEAFHNMRRCGCVGLKVGVESFSQTGLDYLNKGYKSEELVKTIDFIVSCGFRVFLSLMDNIPTETEDDKKRTKDIVQHFVEMGCSIQHPNCMPLPGTSLFKDLDSKGEMDCGDWTKYGKYHGETIKI